jgi:hypothetical protein
VTKRNLHVAASMANGKIALAGGNNTTTDVDSVEIFDPTANNLGFTSGAAMFEARNRAAGAYAASEDRLIVVGGNATAHTFNTPDAEQVSAP